MSQGRASSLAQELANNQISRAGAFSQTEVLFFSISFDVLAEMFSWVCGLFDESKSRAVRSGLATERTPTIWRKKILAQTVKCVRFLTSNVSFCIEKGRRAGGPESKPKTSKPLAHGQSYFCKQPLDAKVRASYRR